jgi:hypothetical protein
LGIFLSQRTFICEGSDIPHYFFHSSSKDLTTWDGFGFDLPDLWRAEDVEMVGALWHEVLAKQLHPGEVLMIMDTSDQVLFVGTFLR